MMQKTCYSELEKEFQNHKIHLDEEKEKVSNHEFKQLIIETWIGFCTNTILQINKQFNLTEYELADLNLMYDKRFEEYYENSMKENKSYPMMEFNK